MKPICLTLFGLLISSSSIADEFKAVPPSIYLSYAYGRLGHNFEVSLGLQKRDPANSFGGIYYGQEQIEGGGHTESLGLLAFTLSPSAQSDYGAKVNIGVSRTTSRGYNRKGLEAGAFGYDFLSDRLSIFAGAVLRPTLMSNMYKTSSEIEYAAKIGVNYHVHSGVELYSQYHYSGILDSKYSSRRFASGFQLGIAILY